MTDRSETVHRFSWLPYTPQNPSDNVLVVVCDCGWADITNSEDIGSGWDAASLYVEHVKGAESGRQDGG